VMLKLLLFTGMRNAELVHLRLTDVDLQTCQLRITQGKGAKDRYVLFLLSFRGGHWFRLMQSSMCFALGNCLNKENLIER